MFEIRFHLPASGSERPIKLVTPLLGLFDMNRHIRFHQLLTLDGQQGLFVPWVGASGRSRRRRRHIHFTLEKLPTFMAR